MGNTEFMAQIGKGSQYSPEDNVFDSVWNQYERVILNSLLTSFVSVTTKVRFHSAVSLMGSLFPMVQH